MPTDVPRVQGELEGLARVHLQDVHRWLEGEWESNRAALLQEVEDFDPDIAVIGEGADDSAGRERHAFSTWILLLVRQLTVHLSTTPLENTAPSFEKLLVRFADEQVYPPRAILSSVRYWWLIKRHPWITRESRPTQLEGFNPTLGIRGHAIRNLVIRASECIAPARGGAPSSWPSAIQGHDGMEQLRQDLELLASRLGEECLHEREPSTDEVMRVHLLMRFAELTRHALVSREEKHAILQHSIQWFAVAKPEATWSTRFRCSVLIGTIASIDAIDWTICPAIVALYNGHAASLGDYWLIPMAQLFANEEQSTRIAEAVAARMAATADFDKLEHAVLNLCEGLRTGLVIAAEGALVGAQAFEERVIRCLASVSCAHVERMSSPRPRLIELRLLLMYANLAQSQQILITAGASRASERAGELAKEARALILDDWLLLCCDKFARALKEVERPWHLEGACLHEDKLWGPGVSEMSLRQALTALYEKVINRDSYSGKGWQSWVYLFLHFGTRCQYEPVRDIAARAMQLDREARNQ